MSMRWDIDRQCTGIDDIDLRMPMEELLIFNNVKVLLTTGEKLSEVQNFLEMADVVISVYPSRVCILRGPKCPELKRMQGTTPIYEGE